MMNSETMELTVGLTKEESEMLVIYYVEEATIDEIAAIYDSDPIAVQATLDCAKNKVKRFLKKTQYNPMRSY